MIPKKLKIFTTGVYVNWIRTVLSERVYDSVYVESSFGTKDIAHPTLIWTEFNPNPQIPFRLFYSPKRHWIPCHPNRFCKSASRIMWHVNFGLWNCQWIIKRLGTDNGCWASQVTKCPFYPDTKSCNRISCAEVSEYRASWRSQFLWSKRRQGM